jgi:Predicted membrane protein (DUF2306)
MSGSVLSVSSRALIDACARLGIDTGQVLEAARLGPATLQDPDARIPVERGIAVLGGGLSALYISQFAFGGSVARLGFALLAVCWLYTGARAFLAIRATRIISHREWMIRNVALTSAAVTLRVYLPAALVVGG